MPIPCPTECLTRWRCVNTPVGSILLTHHQHGRIETTFDLSETRKPDGIHDPSLLPKVAQWLATCTEQHAGPAPTRVPDGPPFHRACWKACRQIKLGHTKTYAELAAMAGRPGAARAAGTAMRTNPQSLLTPCHRVVSRSGLGGFSGATSSHSPWLQLKSRLLTLEQASTHTL
ncbi:MAG: methylated-DNA--[protein]-cysteine S-methyltransferase [Phycisphaerales bacterium]|nr:methylated-DNA--[protein]-cysteine S-methyltransferase [Phycisphaerales bacterium]